VEGVRDALARREPDGPLPVVAAELGGDVGLLGAADLLGAPDGPGTLGTAGDGPRDAAPEA
jgi:hypothetical protein